jgi:hypothetical protein
LPNIAAQAGVFTLLRQKNVGGRQPFEGTVDLDGYLVGRPECPLVKVTLAVAEAAAVILLCEKYGVTAATLFPDYYGAAKASMDWLRCWRWERGHQSGEGAAT